VNKSSPKTVTAEKAVEAIESHDDVVLANFCGEPRLLPMALMNRAHELLGVRTSIWSREWKNTSGVPLHFVVGAKA
jgi:acyl-CoA hydrolase